MTPSQSSYPTSLSGQDMSRFSSKIEKTDGCWLWTSALAKNGYGVFSLGGKTVYAHRLSFSINCGSPSTLLVLDHICRVRNCVNPSHMREIGRGENVSIGRNRLRERTECVNGHPFTAANTRTTGNQRSCRICHRKSNQEYMKRILANRVSYMEAIYD